MGGGSVGKFLFESNAGRPGLPESGRVLQPPGAGR